MSKRPFVKVDNTGNMVDLPLDAASLDGHQMEQIGIESDTTTIPTTAQVKEFVNKNITSEGTTKSAVAYQDNVSANACPYAILNTLGGMSYKSENLIKIIGTSYNDTGGTVTISTDGTITISNIQRTGNIVFRHNLSILTNTTLYWKLFAYELSSYLRCNVKYNESDNYTYNVPSLSSNNSYSANYTYGYNSYSIQIEMNITNSDVSRGYATFKLMVIKGDTAPTDYQPYFDDIRDSAITSVISKDSNNTVLQTITIPQEIQALEGYGWGINSRVYNYIDFENKKFIQKVGRVDLGTLDWLYSTQTITNVFYTPIAPLNMPSNNANMLTSIYIPENNFWGIANNDMKIASGGSYLNISNSNYTNAETFKTAMSGVYLYYELATPIETDISSYLPADFNSIQIEANGTITFDNTYQQAIPYEYLYDIGVIPIVDEKLSNYLSKAKITLSGTTLTIDLD